MSDRQEELSASHQAVSQASAQVGKINQDMIQGIQVTAESQKNRDQMEIERSRIEELYSLRFRIHQLEEVAKHNKALCTDIAAIEHPTLSEWREIRRKAGAQPSLSENLPSSPSLG